MKQVRIRSVEYIGDYKLKITFTDGHVNTFDYKSLVTSGHEEFSPYLDVTKFKKFKISRMRDEIYWGEEDMLVHFNSLYGRKNAHWKRNFKIAA